MSTEKYPAELVERFCEAQHDAYEAAAVREGWETQEASRKPWADVPEANKATMRASVVAALDAIGLQEDRRTVVLAGHATPVKAKPGKYVRYLTPWEVVTDE